MKRLGLTFILGAAFILISETSVLACSACFGQSDSSMARSLNASIFTLMGVIGTVLVGAASFLFSWPGGPRRRPKPNRPNLLLTPTPGLTHARFTQIWNKLAAVFCLWLAVDTRHPGTWFTASPPRICPWTHSVQGHEVDQLIIYVHVLMGILFVGWIGYFFYVIMRFSKKANPKADYHGAKGHASTYVEVIVALFEAVLLIGFAIPVWSRAVDKFPDAKDSTVIKVIAQQFQWNGWYPGPHGKFCTNDEKFISSENPFGLDKADPNYKENFFVLSELVVPVDKPVLAYVSSLDVIHCFAVKPMRVTQDAIPGMVFPAHFTPKTLGTYQINCAQLCGMGHYTMKGSIKVVSQPDYDKWVATKSKAGAGGASYE